MIRADASRELGTGHVMRCLTLAERLRQKTANVVFACVSQPGDMVELIRAAGFEVVDARWSPPRNVDWLVIDHYGLDRAYASDMREVACRIFVIDDLANRPHDCDLLLDQNLYEDMHARYQTLVPAHALTLHGPQYALLRSEFVEARQKIRRQQAVRRILVFFGGSDPTNETLKTMRALRHVELDAADIHVDVLIGVTNVQREEVKAFALSMRRTTVIEQTKQISALMLDADLAIGGGGTTSWERCCLGLPAIVVAVADNQHALSQTLGSRGYQRYLGRHEQVSEQALAGAISAAIAQYPQFAAEALRGMDLVDGLGVHRVAAAMESS
jgi:UDP-2,4-diacetamido-2,4,6-trideoxy-beta-L-altropyranose hydrolase